jgi:hypothetical protein
MRILSSFIGFLLAISVTIVVFAPERLPAGLGIKPVPVELVVENSLAGQIMEKLIGDSGKDLVLTNIHNRPLYNVTVTLRDTEQNIKHQHISQTLPASERLRLGWIKQWRIDPGDQLEVSASAYYKVVWAL